MLLSSYSHNPEEMLTDQFSVAKRGPSERKEGEKKTRWDVIHTRANFYVRGVISSESAVTGAGTASDTHLISRRVTCPPFPGW